MNLSKLMLSAYTLLVAVTLPCGAEIPSNFDQANAAFAEKRYAEAASEYEAVISRQGFSASVLFNLANTYYRDGNLGRAILNYERAQLLVPRDVDIAANLSVALHKAGIAEQPQQWTHQFNLNTLSWLASLAMIFIAAGLLFRQFTKRTSFTWRVWIVANLCVLLMAIFVLLFRWPVMNRGIVTVKNVPVFIAPITVTQPLFTLTEGQSVSIRKTSGDFLLVDPGDGRRGWVTREEVGQLIPSAAQAERHI